MINNLVVNTLHTTPKFYFAPQKFPCPRQIITSKFMGDLRPRPQKIRPPSVRVYYFYEKRREERRPV